MKRSAVVLGLVSFVLGMQFCSAPEEKSQGKNFDKLNPNNNSELAILMRKMNDNLRENRKLLMEGKEPIPFPADFEKIHTAGLTDGMVKTDEFETMGNLYLLTLKKYEHSDSEGRTIAFNNLVNTCITCHSQHCPGPIAGMKKLVIR